MVTSTDFMIHMASSKNIMTAQEQVKIVQRREKALFDMERTLFNIGTNRCGGSVVRMADDFYGRPKEMDELKTINNIREQ